MLSRGSSVCGDILDVLPWITLDTVAVLRPNFPAMSTIRTRFPCMAGAPSLFLLYGGAARRAKVKRVTSHKKHPAFLANLPKQPGYVYRLWINFLSSPCLTAAFRMTHVRKASMGSMIVFLTAPEVR